MIIVYSAANSLEAHMIKGLLEQHEIPAYVQGEHLQSGVGELPAISGLVKVSVDNENKEKAIKVIKNWETQNPSPEKPKTKSENQIKKSSFSSISSIVSFLAGLLCMYLYSTSPTFTDRRDFNDDGKIDANWKYHNKELLSYSADMNFDGEVDVKTTFKDNQTDKSKQDSDFDGTFETEYYYRNESAYLQKVDTNNDENFDSITEFETNPLNVKNTIYSSKTGLIKKIQYYKMSKLKSAKFDSDNDGKLDQLIKYDDFEEEISRTPFN